MKPIIKVEGLSKQYRIGAHEKPHQTIREALALAFASPFKGRSANGGSSNTIWALEDVEFDVYPGEIVGIIGRNGAGKSTLLKVLSGVTEPTNGRAAIYGRVGSLLEVGTGFHPELTGRENVFLNGAILGMKKVEIKRKFDEIVAFSEIEKFLDTPVKHYSSGMYMRLAFAVAAHLEPEVLLVDEVLAVGDADFQKKCLTKIRDVAQKGRTVLFVTHNLSSITMLCTRALFFSSGHIIDDGPPMKVVDNYMSKVRTGKPYVEWENPAKAPGTDRMRLKSVRILNEAGQVTGSFGMDDPIFVEITYWLQQSGLETNAGYHLYNSTGVLAFISQDLHDKEWLNVQKDSGCYRSVGRIPGQFLNEGTYFLDAVLFKSPGPRTDVYERELLVFEVVDRGHSEVRGRFTGNWSVGVLRPNLPWKTTRMSENT